MRRHGHGLFFCDALTCFREALCVIYQVYGAGDPEALFFFCSLGCAWFPSTYVQLNRSGRSLLHPVRRSLLHVILFSMSPPSYIFKMLMDLSYSLPINMLPWPFILVCNSRPLSSAYPPSSTSYRISSVCSRSPEDATHRPHQPSSPPSPRDFGVKHRFGHASRFTAEMHVGEPYLHMRFLNFEF